MEPAANSLEGKARPYLERIEHLLQAIKEHQEECKRQSKMCREDIREIYQEAKDKGMPVNALKALVKYRQLEIRQEEIPIIMSDQMDKAAYLQLVEALGALGEAAARRAGAL